MSPISALAKALAARSVRFVLIGVSGVNLYTPRPGSAFLTDDYDLFLPPEAANLFQAWAACDGCGLELWLGREPLDRPRDEWLARKVVERRVATRVTGQEEFLVDLTLEMKGYDFETVWDTRRTFIIDDAEIPVARLRHIIESKLAANRDKDRLFLATHRDVLEQLLKKPEID